jgi:hypothetical protein
MHQCIWKITDTYIPLFWDSNQYKGEIKMIVPQKKIADWRKSVEDRFDKIHCRMSRLEGENVIIILLLVALLAKALT